MKSESNNIPLSVSRWSSTHKEDQFVVDNPATGKPIAVVQGGGATEIDGGCLALRTARQIDVGIVFVNNYFRGGIGMPFGGTKATGFGREHCIETLYEYGRTKAVRVPSVIGQIPQWRLFG